MRALIVEDGHYYLFVQVTGEPDTFERRVVGVAQEKDDHAIIDSGLKKGEAVVSVVPPQVLKVEEEVAAAVEGEEAVAEAEGATGEEAGEQGDESEES